MNQAQHCHCETYKPTHPPGVAFPLTLFTTQRRFMNIDLNASYSGNVFTTSAPTV
ncbi:hypothetical protein CY34DRAFT_809544, partial [Suillus luteus UH-Slu-Lm8-n1]